jgi:hypothetical protein
MRPSENWMLRICVLAFVVFMGFTFYRAIFVDSESITVGSWVGVGLLFLVSLYLVAASEKHFIDGSDRLVNFWIMFTRICFWGIVSMSVLLAFIGFL